MKAISMVSCQPSTSACLQNEETCVLFASSVLSLGVDTTWAAINGCSSNHPKRSQYTQSLTPEST